MTDAELEEENKRLEEEGIRKKKQEHVQGTFLQKYYHKGIFYLDDESIQSPDDIRNRMDRMVEDLTECPCELIHQSLSAAIL